MENIFIFSSANHIIDLCSGKYANYSQFYYNATYVFLYHHVKLHSKNHRAYGRNRVGGQHYPSFAHKKDRNLIKMVIQFYTC